MRPTKMVGSIVQQGAAEPTLTEKARKRIPQQQRKAQQNTKDMARALLEQAGVTNEMIISNYDTVNGNIFDAINKSTKSQLSSPEAMVQAQQTMQEQQVQKVPVVVQVQPIAQQIQPPKLPDYQPLIHNPLQPHPIVLSAEQRDVVRLQAQVQQLEAQIKQSQQKPLEPQFMETGPRPLDRTMPTRRTTTFPRQVGPKPPPGRGDRFGKIMETFNRRNFRGDKG